MFHSRDSPRLVVCDTGLCLEQNDIGFITVAICGGYISKYPRLFVNVNSAENPSDLYALTEIAYAGKLLRNTWGISIVLL